MTAKADDGLPAELQLDLQHIELYGVRLASACESLAQQGGLKAIRGRVKRARLLRLVARLDEARRALDDLLEGANRNELEARP